MGRLSRKKDHDYKESDDEYDLRCESCGKPWNRSWGEPKLKYCDGLAKTQLNSVSQNGRKNRENFEGEKHTYGDYFKWVSTEIPCIICGRLDGAPADHYKTVGSGGRDKKNLIPLCQNHQDRHDLGIETWKNRYNLSSEKLEEVTNGLWREYKK